MLKKMNPATYKQEYKTLKSWHDNLRYLCEKENLKGNDETRFLEEILPDKKQEYYDQIETLGNLTEHFSKKEKKGFFELMASTGLHDDLRGAPFFFHGIFKPRGYAGDAEAMAVIYRNRFEGADTFSKLMNKFATESAACIAIRNRKTLLRNAFGEIQNGNILSLAAGPAQEIFEYLPNNKNHNFLALDHDIKTLTNANAQSMNGHLTYGIANAFHLIKGTRKYLLPRKNKLGKCDPKNDSRGIKKILLPYKYKIKELQPNSFDLIYSLGLFDYIKTFSDPKKGTLALTKTLFGLLKPGGRLLIGNVSPTMPTGIVWAMECLCDWHLIYRTKKEVLEFAGAIPEHEIKSMEVISEETGINWFLDVRKK